MQDRYTGISTQTLWRMSVTTDALMSHLPHVQKSATENLLPKTFDVSPQKPPAISIGKEEGQKRKGCHFYSSLQLKALTDYLASAGPL